MPKPSIHTLVWSEMQQHYELQTHGQTEQRFRPGDEPAFSLWLAGHTAFAFVGQAGRLSVIKEARSRGAGYWYAYRRQERQTHKRYLGPTAQVTFARLEQTAAALDSSPSATPPSPKPEAPSSGQKDVLLSTKLFPPRLPTSLVERSRLIRDLDEARSHPLTLVSASAGSGKTTLLSAWAATFRKPQAGGRGAAGAELVVAWLSLDALDDEPIRFWASVIAALRTALPRIGEDALALLRSPESPPLSTVLTVLLNEIEQIGSELILILDDYHVISDQAIAEAMLFLLDHLPANLHLVLATRADPELPLSRLRVRGQMIEIRSSDLRFTQAETTDFLLKGMGMPLSEEDLATLQCRTEGWIAGLQLAALSLRKRQDVSGFVQDFAGSYRYLLDYVQQDILAQLPASLQHFVLQTSVLTGMSASLCQAVAALPTLQESQERLEELERANLFVVMLDEERQWYRYHDLFREALRARLYASQPELVPLLHIRAARWYESQGEWREAIAHALAAPDHSLAASLMEQVAPHFWLSGEASTVLNWVLALPDVVLRAHTRLALNAALRFLNSVHISTETVHAGMVAQVERIIARMEAILRDQGELSLSEAEVALIERRVRLLRALIQARAIMGRGDKERMRLLTQEIELLSPDDEVSWKMIPLTFAFWLTLALQQTGAPMIPRLRSAKQWIVGARDPLATIRVTTWLSRAYIEAGQLHLAYQECQEALALLEQIGGSIAVAGYLLSSLFDVCYAWDRLEEASDALRRLQRVAQDWQQVELLVIGESTQARFALAKGDVTAAQVALRNAEALVEQEGFASNVRRAAETRVQVWLAQNNLSEANNWAKQIALSPEEWDPVHKWEVLLVVRVLLAQQQYAQAVETLERFSRHLDQPEDVEKALEWMALYMVALHHAGKRAQAARVAARLFALTEPEGYIRLYLDTGEPMRQALEALRDSADNKGRDASQQDGESASIVSLSTSYISRLLAAFEQAGRKRTLRTGMPLAGQQDVQPEPLSRQEQQVLRLLVAGQTYAEIAEALIVSPNTIKTQVSSIYRKLGVRRRAEAIAMTQQLRLL
jgi:ATP/maltotriose-dependent transcriptional regulator MalT